MMKKMIMTLCMFICAFTLVACSGQQTNEPLTLGVNAIITEIDKENKIITTKDSGEEGVLGEDCLIDCSQIPMIYCNYDTHDVVDITLDDLQVGDEIILTIRSSEIENHQKEDENKGKIAVEQLQLGTQRIKKFPVYRTDKLIHERDSASRFRLAVLLRLILQHRFYHGKCKLLFAGRGIFPECFYLPNGTNFVFFQFVL